MMKSIVCLASILSFPGIVAAQTRSIVVSARSEVEVKPDEVVLGLRVHTRNENLLAAKQENERISVAVLKLAPKYDLPQQAVKITGLDVSPDYGRYSQRETKPVAYDFTRSIEIRLRDFKKLEPVLAEAFGAGLSHVDRLHFRISNQRTHQFEARKLAVIYAREKAEHLTELTGMKIGLPIRIEENIEYNWDAGGFGGGAGLGLNVPDYQRGGLERIGPKVVFAKHQVNSAEESMVQDTLAAPGQVVIKAQVKVEFEMMPK